MYGLFSFLACLDLHFIIIYLFGSISIVCCKSKLSVVNLNCVYDQWCRQWFAMVLRFLTEGRDLAASVLKGKSYQFICPPQILNFKYSALTSDLFLLILGVCKVVNLPTQ